MQNVFLHNRVFRIVFPPFFGSLIYILLLLVFNNVSQLLENFFTQEVLLCIVLAYFSLESLNLLVKILNRLMPLSGKQNLRIVMQILLHILISFVVVSLVLWAYFNIIVGFSSFRIEWISFNTLFILSSVFFNLLYISVYFMGKQSELEIINENTKRQSVELKLQLFVNEVNPGLLYNSLETLITLIRNRPREAEGFINNLSSVYRYKLNQKKAEFTDLGKEIQSLNHLLYLYNYRYAGNIMAYIQIPKSYYSYCVIPGTLHNLIHYAVEQNIISKMQRLKINCSICDDDYLCLEASMSRRLDPTIKSDFRLDNLISSYAHYTDHPLLIEETGSSLIMKVPLLSLEESDSEEPGYEVFEKTNAE